MSAAPATSRRYFLFTSACGFGGVALSWLLTNEARAAITASPYAPRTPQFPARAKRVIHICALGGVSHLDTFDYKPELEKRHGQDAGRSFDTFFGQPGKLLKSPFAFRRHGASGRWCSDLLPHLATCVDDLTFIHSMHSRSSNHTPATFLMDSGFTFNGFPSVGAWVSYGLGSENQNLPAFVVLPDPGGWPKGGAPAWGNGYLPATYQGTILRGGESPILDLNTPRGISAEQQRATVDFVNKLNREHLHRGEESSELSARIAAYELAFRMQSHAPEVVNLARESDATRRLYGLDSKVTAEFGTRCLLARRLVEAGVRFVQVYCGDTNGWDGHSKMEENHSKLCAQSDLPVAGLLKDLKARGLLESTLVVWGGEFGRMPMSEGSDGRDHNPHGFSMWLAGGGVKGGQIIGTTDAVGLRATEDKTHVHDIHATILQLLGFDHEQLTFRHNGRDERLTDVAGNVIGKALA